jgi:hypothetical protein
MPVCASQPASQPATMIHGGVNQRRLNTIRYASRAMHDRNVPACQRQQTPRFAGRTRNISPRHATPRHATKSRPRRGQAAMRWNATAYSKIVLTRSTVGLVLCFVCLCLDGWMDGWIVGWIHGRSSVLMLGGRPPVVEVPGAGDEDEAEAGDEAAGAVVSTVMWQWQWCRSSRSFTLLELFLFFFDDDAFLQRHYYGDRTLRSGIVRGVSVFICCLRSCEYFQVSVDGRSTVFTVSIFLLFSFEGVA